jgi:hypothetical protein
LIQCCPVSNNVLFTSVRLSLKRHSNAGAINNLKNGQNIQASVSIADIYTAGAPDLYCRIPGMGLYRNPSFELIIDFLKCKKMDEFILIFRHEDGGKVASPEQIQIWMKQTMDWIGTITAKNKFVGGNGLSFPDARVVHHNNVVTDGPFGEIKETIGGYIIVKAESVEEAVEFAKGCPVLQGEGNTVEVRMIARRDGIH